MSSSARVTPRQEDIIRHKLAHGARLAEIARACGRSDTWAGEAVRTLGLKLRPPPGHIEFSAAADAFIRDSRAGKRSWDYIAGRLKISRTAVRARVAALRALDAGEDKPADILSGPHRGAADNALPAGHPLTWGAIVSEVPSLAGVSF